MEFLLPQSGKLFEASGWPGGIRQQFVAARGLVESVLLDLKRLPGLQVPSPLPSLPCLLTLPPSSCVRMCACVRACMRARVCVCVRVCVSVFACVHVTAFVWCTMCAVPFCASMSHGMTRARSDFLTHG